MNWVVMSVLFVGIAIVLLYLIVQAVRCRVAVGGARKRLATYNAKTILLSYGDMTYVDVGEGEVILSVHGIFGGYDQAFDTCKDFNDEYRVIAPSRFGYLSSDVMGDGSPEQQAKAFVELLDRLEVEKVYVLAASAGGSVAIRFALDYPERVKGLILYCSAMPYLKKPVNYPTYAGPPAFLCNSFAMFALSPLFRPIMGMEPSTIYSMLPVEPRKAGVVLDASVTNPDMARNFDEYPIEHLQMPTLIFHAKDDKLVKYEDAERALSRFPDHNFISFETGGHLMAGHAQEIKEAVGLFTKQEYV